ncbi:ribonuclease E inhibitor RraB [Litorisediminicola beolgyonensis]|uniref:Ribonuclease E inhibitor RraB n=1 Tax=Litorisediminicola beolgyonensis TaxID=1173614 RepID=A0ABW3ZG54_9RHOB
MNEAHDFSAQRAETFAVFRNLNDSADLPEIADVDYFFVASEGEIDWPALADALAAEGYLCELVDETGEDAEAPYMVATLTEQPLSAEGIWIGEEIATRIALARGARPDGWGFSA